LIVLKFKAATFSLQCIINYKKSCLSVQVPIVYYANEYIKSQTYLPQKWTYFQMNLKEKGS